MTMVWLLLACAPEPLPDAGERLPVNDSCPIDGSQIGEPDGDCFGDRIRVALRLDGLPVRGDLAWTRIGCGVFDLACPDGDCDIHVADAGVFEVTATVGDASETREVTLDEADRTTCDDCCEGDARIETVVFDF